MEQNPLPISTTEIESLKDVIRHHRATLFADPPIELEKRKNAAVKLAECMKKLTDWRKRRVQGCEPVPTSDQAIEKLKEAITEQFTRPGESQGVKRALEDDEQKDSEEEEWGVWAEAMDTTGGTEALLREIERLAVELSGDSERMAKRVRHEDTQA